MYTLLNSDVFKCISQHACFVDVMSMRRSCKHFRKMPMPIFADRFAAKFFPLYGLPPTARILDVFPNIEAYEAEKARIRALLSTIDDVHVTYYSLTQRYPELLKRMLDLRCGLVHEIFQSGAIVCGSFILDVLYDTNYHQDIDIYERGNNELDDDRYKFHFGDQHLRFSQFLWCCGFCPSDGARVPGVGVVYNYIPSFSVVDEIRRPQGSLIQAIPVPMDVKRMISASFDLDICKSSFDGRRLTVRSWRKLIERYDYMKCNTRYFMTFYNVHGQCVIVNPKKKMGPRIRKYGARGFNIQRHPLLEQIAHELIEIIEDSIPGPISFVINGTIDLDKYYLE